MARVAYTDHGIAPEKQERILERFYRVEYARVEYATACHIVGSGLSLCIVKRVVDFLGSKIGLDSAPGQDSTLTVRLPGV